MRGSTSDQNVSPSLTSDTDAEDSHAAQDCPVCGAHGAGHLHVPIWEFVDVNKDLECFVRSMEFTVAQFNDASTEGQAYGLLDGG